MSGPLPTLPVLPDHDDPEGAGQYRAFGVPLAYGVAVPMVELRLRTGRRLALPYPWLGQAEYDPGGWVTLAFTTGARVRLGGRSLLPLFLALVRHEAVWVWEADAPTALLVPAGVPVVEAVVVELPPATP